MARRSQLCPCHSMSNFDSSWRFPKMRVPLYKSSILMGWSWIVHCKWPSWGIPMEGPLILDACWCLLVNHCHFGPIAPGLEIWGPSFYVFHTARSITATTMKFLQAGATAWEDAAWSFRGWITVLRWPMLGYIIWGNFITTSLRPNPGIMVRIRGIIPTWGLNSG